MDTKSVLFIVFQVVILTEGIKFYTTANDNKKYVDIKKICNDAKPCISKCCGIHERLTRIKGVTKCVKNDRKFDYTQIGIRDYKTRKRIVNKTILDIFTIVHSQAFFENNNYYIIILNKNDTLYNNGVFETETIMQRFEPLEFCIEFRNNTTLTARILKNHSTDISVYLVLSMNVAMYISAFLLLFNLYIYLILPEKSLTEMMRAAYVTSMALTFTFKSSIHLALQYDNLTTPQIHVLGPITYFLALSSFSWLTIMSVDIWWTFRGTRKHRPIHRRGIIHKFFVYCIFGFGGPAIITIVAVSMDFINSIPDNMKPKFKAFFTASSVIAVRYYLHVPLTALIILNCLLFIMTVYNIWLIKRRLGSFNQTETRTTMENQQKFMIFLKLSLFMGLNWIIEFMQSFIADLPVWLIVPADFYNAFCGLIIFYLFVLDKSVIRRLEKKFGVSLRCKKNTETNDRRENSKRTPLPSEDSAVTDI